MWIDKTVLFCDNFDGLSIYLINEGMYIRMLTILGTILLPHGFPIAAQIAAFDMESYLAMFLMFDTRFRVRGVRYRER